MNLILKARRDSVLQFAVQFVAQKMNLLTHNLVLQHRQQTVLVERQLFD